MAEHGDEIEPKADFSFMDKASEKIHRDDSSSSSSSDNESDKKKKYPVHKDAPVTSSSMKAKIYRLFGREKPVHKVFGGGKLSELEERMVLE
ncbi:hypothetical protein Tco_1282348 [Tanacetum coccineum]